jgi:aminotransferase
MRNFVSSRVQNIPPSGIRRFFDIAATMDDIISLGVGEPDFVTPRPFLQAGIDSLLEGHTHYTSNSGILELRQALSEHLNQMYGVSYDPEDEIVITVGVSEALYLVMTAILDPDDEVIVPEPCFVAYAPEVVLAGGVARTIPTFVADNFQVTGATIEAAIPTTRPALSCPVNVCWRSPPWPRSMICWSSPMRFTTSWYTACSMSVLLPCRGCAIAPLRWEAFLKTTL